MESDATTKIGKLREAETGKVGRFSLGCQWRSPECSLEYTVERRPGWRQKFGSHQYTCADNRVFNYCTLRAGTVLSTSYHSFIHQNPMNRNYHPHFIGKSIVTKYAEIK